MATPQTATIAVIGAGSWGTGLSVLFAGNGHFVRLWGHVPAHVATLKKDRENRRHLPGVSFPPRLHPEPDLAAAVAAVAEVVVVVPSHAFRAIITALATTVAGGSPLSLPTHRFHPEARGLLTEAAAELLPEHDLAVISGPSFAREVARGLPTAVTVAATSSAHAERVAAYLHNETFRAYTSADLIGVQVGGATKNVMAIAAGISDGLGFGANARAALITRGLAEITRLGVALGGQGETFVGLAGLGDLALTCTDDQSRNRRMGLALARGLSVEAARKEIGQAVEGVKTTREVYRLSRRLGVDMPITVQVYRVLYEGLAPHDAVHMLLHRPQREEAE
ncbi:NAD(P)H-dependent glycerol-3-phosphate dehydrogenase [Thiohalocapsa sp.]|uniref:NAD(P)H-dependent glycerol-3-phosphate dehydrogenase n=1 Tax=Thiohalocapsa sp. TaxID=2497641 RepID=UPI0025F5D18B|nr:NAD(P)H-dependent glycerol-3-phosphate dehydrogenase [Thiohalocapsa sp.]